VNPYPIDERYKNLDLDVIFSKVPIPMDIEKNEIVANEKNEIVANENKIDVDENDDTKMVVDENEMVADENEIDVDENDDTKMDID
jgi:hypothetical protein